MRSERWGVRGKKRVIIEEKETQQTPGISYCTSNPNMQKNWHILRTISTHPLILLTKNLHNYFCRLHTNGEKSVSPASQ